MMLLLKETGTRFSIAVPIWRQIAFLTVLKLCALFCLSANLHAVDIMKPGATVELRNAKIDMFKGSMRLAVDKWGIVEPAETPADFTIKEDNNLPLIEFELVTVLEWQLFFHFPFNLCVGGGWYVMSLSRFSPFFPTKQ
jgi:hypothetical protein